MANQEHLEILKQGVEVWNRWRNENPAIKPDFQGLHLSSLHLPGINLEKAELSHSYLFSAILTGANLAGANLLRAEWEGVDLSGAHLEQAYLSNISFIGVILKDAILSGADLTSAQLLGTFLQNVMLDHCKLLFANFRDSEMAGADLTEAWIFLTSFGENNLDQVHGLETVRHSGPSPISIQTLARSKGNIPRRFLVGCGLSNWQIENAKLFNPDLSNGEVNDILYNLHELRTDPAIQFHSCFISYSSKDHDFAEMLYEQLQDKGVRCWFAPEDLKIGDPFRQRIDEAIRLHDKLLLILSAESVASNWVASEVEAALEREDREKRLVLFPMRIDDAIEQCDTAWAAHLRRTRHIGDFSNWKDHDSYSKAFERLLRDLKAEDKA